MSSSKKLPREFVENFVKMNKSPVSNPPSELKPTNIMSTVAKWVPLICAGAAVGVSVMALKEIHNVRKELVLAKKELGHNDELGKRMELMEQQLKSISDFMKNSKPKPKVRSRSPIIKQVVDPGVRIVNENVQENFDTNEYEEVEVTDNDEPEEEK